MWSVWLVFCGCCFHSACPLMDKDKRLMEASWGERLTVGVTGSLCCMTWGQTMVEILKIMVTSFKRSHACTAALTATNPAAGHCQPTPPSETPGHSPGSLRQPLVGSLLLYPGSWWSQDFVFAFQGSVSPVLCKFWNQIPLASKVRFSGSSQPFFHILRLGNLLWVLELF